MYAIRFVFICKKKSKAYILTIMYYFALFCHIKSQWKPVGLFYERFAQTGANVMAVKPHNHKVQNTQRRICKCIDLPPAMPFIKPESDWGCCFCVCVNHIWKTGANYLHTLWRAGGTMTEDISCQKFGSFREYEIRIITHIFTLQISFAGLYEAHHGLDLAGYVWVKDASNIPYV